MESFEITSIEWEDDEIQLVCDKISDILVHLDTEIDNALDCENRMNNLVFHYQEIEKALRILQKARKEIQHGNAYEIEAEILQDKAEIENEIFREREMLADI